MTQNILTAFDAWLDTWPGHGENLKKPDTGVTQMTGKTAANEPTQHQAADRPDVITSSGVVIRHQAGAASWRSLSDAYYQHHFGCLSCIAAGQNPYLKRCQIGRPLWDAYRAAVETMRQGERHD